tara:strand:- start:115 stop:843 length:729 start_codon:yes stop_codon:yes gene_type:complete
VNLKFCLSTITLILSFTIFSQISTDRPDQTEGTFVLDKGIAQIESGWTFDTDLGSLNTLLRIGTFNGIELRINTNIISGTEDMSGLFPELSNLEVGAKFNLLNKTSSSTKVSLLTHLALGVGDYNNEGILSRLLFSHDLSESVQLAYNLGYNKYFENNIEVNSTGIFVYSLVLSKSFGPVGTFIEVFGNNGSNQTQSNWDLGLTYLIKDNLQADISYGNGINNDLSYLSIGAAWNFSTKSKK